MAKREKIIFFAYTQNLNRLKIVCRRQKIERRFFSTYTSFLTRSDFVCRRKNRQKNFRGLKFFRGALIFKIWWRIKGQLCINILFYIDICTKRVQRWAKLLLKLNALIYILATLPAKFKPFSKL